ncbi:sulfotransferase [Actinomadura luteofluorescens]|uniref:sulfotransferase n=1 Tax=Actinomadura luteofluorescens TaxID=46163 RepID=UPI003D8E0DB8
MHRSSRTHAETSIQIHEFNARSAGSSANARRWPKDSRGMSAEVKAHVPEDRLLVFEVKDGWAPPCAFLGRRRTSDSRQWTPGCARYAACRSCTRGPAPRPMSAPCRRLSTPTRPI